MCASFLVRCGNSFEVSPNPHNSLTNISERVIQAVEGPVEGGARRRKIETQVILAAGAKLLAGTRKYPGSLGDPCGDVIRFETSAGKIHPRKIRAVKTHGSGAGNRSLNALVEKVPAGLEIGEEGVKPRFACTPGRLSRDHAECVVGAETARHDA